MGRGWIASWTRRAGGAAPHGTYRRIGTNLLELGVIDESQLAAALTKASGLPCISGDVEPEQAALDVVSAASAERLGVVPIKLEGKRLKVVLSDPRNFSKLAPTSSGR